MAADENALGAGRAFVDLSFWRKAEVRGNDAEDWLNDLVSADIAGLAPGRARRSLLLTPTGRVRAEFTVAARPSAFVLLQDPSQPAAVLDLLQPFTLSSQVELIDRTEDLALVAFPGLTRPPDVAGVWPSMPSGAGAGVDLLTPAERHDELLEGLRGRFAQVGNEALEAWRIGRGVPRFGVDATGEDLPQEAGFGDAVAFDKGCYLGQEAVAKVRNLGHPRRLLLAFEAAEPVSAGDPVLTDGNEAGEVTSSTTPAGGPTLLLAKVRWDAREGPFQTALGVPLRPRG
jgi:tRNA-modifying protein YgfZ